MSIVGISATLFVFAHQDDEIAFMPEIEKVIKGGNNAICVYLTNGEWKSVRSKTRNLESRRVLNILGVDDRYIFFIGDITGTKSGELPKKAKISIVELDKIFNKFNNIKRIVTFAYEGGHEDHDATFWICSILMQKNKITEMSRCVPFYRSSNSRWLSYTVFDPISKNGEIEVYKIPLICRLKYFFLCLSYPSQFISIIGLLPFIIRQYLIRGEQYLQCVDHGVIHSVPYKSILYENRKRYTYRVFKEDLKKI